MKQLKNNMFRHTQLPTHQKALEQALSRGEVVETEILKQDAVEDNTTVAAVDVGGEKKVAVKKSKRAVPEPLNENHKDYISRQ